MPYKDPEKQREADRRWREANPEKVEKGAAGGVRPTLRSSARRPVGGMKPTLRNAASRAASGERLT
jgi:hypothetical protein